MNEHFSLIHLVYLSIAILFEVIANVLLKLSKGFKKKFLAATAIVFALAAFTALSFAIEGIQLSVAYGIWGGLGLIATAIIGVLLFKEKIHARGWVGMIMLVAGVLLLKFGYLA